MFQLLALCVKAHPADPPLSGTLEWNGSHLLLASQPYAGIGLNVVDAAALWGTGNVKALEDAANLGVPFVRFAAAPYWPDELQSWRADPEKKFSQRLDVAVQAAERLRIRLIPDLLWNPFAFADLCNEPLAALYDKDHNAPRAAISCTRQAASSYATQVVQRYATSPAILFWELSNENNALVDGFMNGSTAACDPERGTPPRRTDEDNFDTAQMVDTFGWLADAIRRADPARRLVNAGTSMPRPFAQHWRDTPRAQVAKHHMDGTLDNRSAFVANLRDTNARTDFVSAHMGELSDNAQRAWLENTTDPVALLETARAAAAGSSQPFYLGEFTATIAKVGGRSYGYAEAVIDWALGVDSRLGGGGGLLSSVWVFEYAPQAAAWSLEPGRDDELLDKLSAANRVLSRAQLRAPPRAARSGVPMGVPRSLNV